MHRGTIENIKNEIEQEKMWMEDKLKLMSTPRQFE